jgi:chromosome segregation ATPase
MQKNPVNELTGVVLLVMGIISSCTTGYETQSSGVRDRSYSIGTGIYNNRVEEQEGRLEEVRHLQREAQQEQRRLAVDVNKKQLQLNEFDKELFRIIQETQQLAEQLANFKPNNTLATEKKSLMTEQVKQINFHIEQLQRDSLINRGEIVTHQQQLMKLNQEVQQLRNDLQRLQ